MGGKSSSSSTSTSTRQTDERVAATDNALAIGGGATATINVTEPASMSQLIEAASEIFGESLEATKLAQSQAVGFQNAAFNKSFEFMAERGQSEGANFLSDVLKYGLPVAALAIVVWGWSKRK